MVDRRVVVVAQRHVAGGADLDLAPDLRPEHDADPSRGRRRLHRRPRAVVRDVQQHQRVHADGRHAGSHGECTSGRHTHMSVGPCR